ncbi:MAG TPA: hypothetical protein VGI96_32840 [Streptosporangiaceae bacterium]
MLRITVADVSQAMLGQVLDAGVAGRNARRAKNETSARADHAIASQFGDSQFVTALLCDLGCLGLRGIGHLLPPVAGKRGAKR